MNNMPQPRTNAWDHLTKNLDRQFGNAPVAPGENQTRPTDTQSQGPKAGGTDRFQQAVEQLRKDR